VIDSCHMRRLACAEQDDISRLCEIVRYKVHTQRTIRYRGENISMPTIEDKNVEWN
jgi:hypothetical protein